MVDNATKWSAEVTCLQEDVAQLHRLGAVPAYRGETPPSDRVRGLPHNAADTMMMMMEKLRNYVREGKMLVCTQSGLPPNTRILTSPSATVEKKLPDRTLSVERRLIRDGRRVNIHCPKQDYWHLDTPSIHDLAVRAAQIRGEFPGIDIIGTKRDIDAAFTRVRLRPDSCRMFSTEFSLGIADDENLIFYYLVLPFGFTGSTGIFGRVMKAVERFHHQHGPNDTTRNGYMRFRSVVYVDDGMFIEPRIGSRPEQSVLRWGKGGSPFLR